VKYLFLLFNGLWHIVSGFLRSIPIVRVFLLGVLLLELPLGRATEKLDIGVPLLLPWVLGSFSLYLLRIILGSIPASEKTLVSSTDTKFNKTMKNLNYNINQKF
jgi:hypothetical protein